MEKVCISGIQNEVEVWHKALVTLIARSHVGIFYMIKENEKEHNELETEIERFRQGKLAAKSPIEHENRESSLQNVMASSHYMSAIDFLSGYRS